MRKYRNDNREKLEKLVCNCCGKSIRIVNGMAMEGVCHIDIPWGYFSGMDGEDHSMDICESCYLKWITTFNVPIAVEERKEML